MRIECPGCGAAYEVREDLLPPGRAARCARCGRSWVPDAPATASSAMVPAPLPDPSGGSAAGRRPLPLRVRPRLGAPPAPAEPPVPSLPPPEEAVESPPGLTVPLLAWVASLALVGGVLAALWLWRAEVVALWPPAARLVQALGGG